MDIDIPKPNPGIAAWLMGPECRGIMHEVATKAALLAQAEIHKQSGALAATVTDSVDVGGHHRDRLVADVTIGQGVDYGAAYEFGADVVAHGERHPDANRAHNVADQVLSQLGGI